MAKNNIKKLYRSRTDRKIFGVCGGLAEYLEIDSIIVRIAFLSMVYLGGSGIFIYLMLALLVPNEPETKKNKQNNKSESSLIRNNNDDNSIFSLQNIIGIIIFLIGLNFLFIEIFRVDLLSWVDWKNVFALIIILFGIYIIRNQNKINNF